MSLVGFDDLYRFADGLPAPISVVAAGGADATVLQALSAGAADADGSNPC